MEDKVTTMGAIGDQNMEAKTEYTRVKREKKVEAVDPMKDKVTAMYSRYNGNINAVASALMIPKHVVEQYLKDENI